MKFTYTDLTTKLFKKWKALSPDAQEYQEISQGAQREYASLRERHEAFESEYKDARSEVDDLTEKLKLAQNRLHRAESHRRTISARLSMMWKKYMAILQP